MSLAKDPLLQMEVSAIDNWLNVLPTLSQTFLQQMDELDAKHATDKGLVEPSKELALLSQIPPKQQPDLDFTGFVRSPSEANRAFLKQILDEGQATDKGLVEPSKEVALLNPKEWPDLDFTGFVRSPSEANRAFLKQILDEHPASNSSCVEPSKEVALPNRIPRKQWQEIDTCSDFDASPTQVSQHQHNHSRSPSTLTGGSHNKRRKCLSGLPFEHRTSPKFKGNLGEIPQRVDGGRSYHTFSTSGESFNSLKRVAIQRLSDLKDKGTPKETNDFQAQQELIRNIEMDELERIQMETLLKHPNHSY